MFTTVLRDRLRNDLVVAACNLDTASLLTHNLRLRFLLKTLHRVSILIVYGNHR